MHRRIDTSYFSSERSVLRFEFVDYPANQRLFWLVVTDDEVDICVKDPGYDVDLLVQTTLKTMTHIWVGDFSVAKARREKKLILEGESELKKSMGSWIGCSVLADVKAAGSKERK
jgi:hypothetical protein